MESRLRDIYTGPSFYTTKFTSPIMKETDSVDRMSGANVQICEY